jgi:hypothetical protein
VTWPKHGPIHFTRHTNPAMPLAYCQMMNPVILRIYRRYSRDWRRVTCRNCRAKRIRERRFSRY